MKYKNYIKLAALLPLLALLGCEANETPGAESQETVPVTIRLGLEKDGLSTRNSADELDNTENEKEINTLTVYIVASDGTEFTLNKDDFNDNNTATIPNMPTGEAHAYAIANYEDEAITQEDMQDSKTTVTAIEKITNEHPYIPMSAKETWSVSSNKDDYQITLIRMVAKMHVTIYDQRKEKTTTRAGSNPSLTIEGLLPSKTNLHRLGIEQVDEPEELDDDDYNPWSWSEISFEEDTEEGKRSFFFFFYLHESEMKEFYLTYKEERQKDRPGSFQTIIPRNRIFPLKIYLTDYHLDIKVEHSEPPIGVYPNPTPTKNGYDITLPAGCEFTITITPQKSVDNAQWESGATWSCEVTNNDFKDKNIFVLDNAIDLPNSEEIENNTSLSFSGHISAVEAQSGNVTLTFTIKDGDAELTFPVVIKIGDLKTRASQAPQPTIIEL